MKFEIRNRWSHAIQFIAEIDCAENERWSVKVGLAVKWAIKTDADLTDADLTDADLTGADLTGADLTGADLTGADLTDADLTRAVLTDADLTDADLTGADLTPVRSDFYDVLLRAIPEVPALLSAIRAGKINGSTYTGECACLAGTIANERGVEVSALGFANASRPAERWFLAIREGDTPDNNTVARVTEKWIVEFMEFVLLSATGVA